jgi:hypothetical protein
MQAVVSKVDPSGDVTIDLNPELAGGTRGAGSGVVVGSCG